MYNNSFIKFNGDLKLDGFKVSKNTLGLSNIVKNYQKLTADTIVMNNYMEKLSADYVSSDALASDRGFYLYKKTPFQTYYNYVGKPEGNAFTFTDYNIRNEEYYHYLATLEKNNVSGETQYISYENLNDDNSLKYEKAMWNKFSLCDIEFDDIKQQYVVTSDVWLLNCNIQSNEITQSTSVTSWETLGKYNKVSIGQKNFDSGIMTCLLGDVKEYIEYKADGQIKNKYGYTEKININSIYSNNQEKEIKWRNFITNGKLKLFKDIKGNKWIIQIMQDSTRNIDYGAIGKVTSISFSWQEIEDSDEYPIVENNFEE